MSNPSPNVATRFQRGNTPKGRPNRAWIRKRLNSREADKDPEIVQILDHQIEAAKSWDVKIVGREEDGTPIKVASSRDSTEAAKFLFGLIGLRPLAAGDDAVALPPDLDRSPGRSLLDIAADVYRHRLVSGQMTEGEFADMVKILLSVDQAKMALLLKLMGKSIAGKTWEEAQELLHGTPTPAPVETSTSATAESTESPSSAAQAARNEDVIADQASPKGCVTDSHAPVIDEALEPLGSAAPAFVAAPDDEDED